MKVTPAAAERPHWQWNLAHLPELCVVSQRRARREDAAGETEIVVDEAPGPECPRCWRRTGEAAGATRADRNLCLRCAAVMATLPERTRETPP